MKLDAQFVTSAFSVGECPRWDRAEIALAGRSNVGKSSILNALAAVKGLARVSKTPGRTRSINLFTLGDSVALADLPGYGYARMPQAEARRLGGAMREYLKGRKNLAGLVMLIDARRGPEREETELATLARARGLALVVVATKCDKLGRAERARALGALDALGAEAILCSAKTGEGIDELRRRVLSLGRAARDGGIGDTRPKS
jgi:GTP-binding protein